MSALIVQWTVTNLWERHNVMNTTFKGSNYASNHVKEYNMNPINDYRQGRRAEFKLKLL